MLRKCRFTSLKFIRQNHSIKEIDPNDNYKEINRYMNLIQTRTDWNSLESQLSELQIQLKVRLMCAIQCHS